jgi:hypothetical protein
MRKDFCINSLLFSAAILLAALFMGCAGNNDISELYSIADRLFIHNGDLYVAGHTYRVTQGGTPNDKAFEKGVLWKNGEILWPALTNCIPNSICATGDDVYMTALEETPSAYPYIGSFEYVWVLFKNGSVQNLGVRSRPSPVFVHNSGEDVYLAGRSYDTNTEYAYATLWKNGAPQYLPMDPSDPSDITGIYAVTVHVSGGDVYVAGDGEYSLRPSDDDPFNYGGRYKTMLWKNGERQYLNDTDVPPAYSYLPKSIFISNQDVFLAEVMWDGVALWKNGERQVSLFPDTFKIASPAGSMFLDWYRLTDHQRVFISCDDMDDMYVAGISENRPALLKNGAVQVLGKVANKSVYDGAYSVIVNGNDVYVAGGANGRATVWKNGVAQELPMPK